MKNSAPTQTTGKRKVKIVLIQDHHKKLLNQQISPFEQQVGIISLEQVENATEFTIRVLRVRHLRYQYHPKTRKFEVQFVSLEKKEKQRRAPWRPTPVRSVTRSSSEI